MAVIAIRADASLMIGSGHIMRCMTLARALRERGHQCHFITRLHKGNLIQFLLDQGFHVHNLSGVTHADAFYQKGAPEYESWLGCSQEQDAADTTSILKQIQPDLIVVDHYGLSASWENAVSSYCKHLVAIDDLAEREHACEILIDTNLGRQETDYATLVPKSCRRLIGTSYALLRDEFRVLRPISLKRRVVPRMRRILVAMGGVDLGNATGQVLDTLDTMQLPGLFEVTVVLGSHAPHLEQIREQVQNMKIPCDLLVNTPRMAWLMSEADLAIGAGGSTSWERSCLGLPAIIIVLADNQRAGALALEKAGAALVIDNTTGIAHGLPSRIEQCIDPESLRGMSEAASQLTDGEGVARVCLAFEECLND